MQQPVVLWEQMDEFGGGRSANGVAGEASLASSAVAGLAQRGSWSFCKRSGSRGSSKHGRTLVYARVSSADQRSDLIGGSRG